MNESRIKNIEENLRMAEQKWYLYHYPHREIDREIEPYLSLPFVEPSRANWLRKARQALFLSANTVAGHLKILPSDYLRWERQEESLSLSRLQRCAEAMDCELVYAIRPKERTLFSQRISAKLTEATVEQIDRFWENFSSHPANLNPSRICLLMAYHMYDPHFRKAQGWSKNQGEEARSVTRFLHAMRRVER